MDLNTIVAVAQPRQRSELPEWIPGDGYLGGGTWLFSEPQPTLRRLIDLASLNWPPLQVQADGFEIAATCTIAQLNAFPMPFDWMVVDLVGGCCRAFLASFKVWETATVGGNLCMSLPAGPMIALMVALDGVCTIWPRGGGERTVAARNFVTGAGRNVLAPGDLLRSIRIPAEALRRRYSLRQMALSPLGRSSALLIGAKDAKSGFALTITASTKRPVQLRFPHVPDAVTLQQELSTAIDDADYHDDVHGAPRWRKKMTGRLAEQICNELGQAQST